MKPASFAYRTPTTVGEALEALAEAPGESKLLAGGQTLVPMLNARLIRPALVVDINGIEELSSIEIKEGRLRVGSMVRQQRLESDTFVRERVPLLVEALAHVAHPPIRARGTVGGSLAHADPAAELPAAALALQACMHISGPRGTRVVPASEFFLGPLLTAVEPDEILTAIELTIPPDGCGWSFLEVARVHGAFALAGAAALVCLDSSGCVERVRVALCGLGGTPWSLSGIEELVVGARPSERVFAKVAQLVQQTAEAHDDGQASALSRRSTAAALTGRALAIAAGRARAVT